MKDATGVKSLEKIKAGLEKRLEIISKEAVAIKAKYDECIGRAQDVRSHIAALQYSIDAIGGEAVDVTGDDDMVRTLTEILTGPPLTMKELKVAVEARGLSPHGIRKALNGIAFTMVGSSKGAKYTLRDSIYMTGAGGATE